MLRFLRAISNRKEEYRERGRPRLGERGLSDADRLVAAAKAQSEAGRWAEAEKALRAALLLDPDDDGAWNLLGIALRQSGKADEARAGFEAALDRNPSNADAHTNLGNICFEQGDLARAETCYRAAVALQPGLLSAWMSLGAVLRRRDRLDEAAACYRSVLTFDPKNGQALSELGSILRARGDAAGAEASFRRAVGANPGDASAKYNLAIACLSRGDFEEGLELYESRFAAFGERMGPARRFADVLGSERRWHGQSLSGARILVWTEQGFGDSIMMLRYLRLLKQQGVRTLLVVCRPELTRLIAAIPTVDRVVSTGDELSPDEFDLHCPIMSLPREFETRPDSIPRHAPYVSASEDIVRAWRTRLSGIRGIKVGIAWAGSGTLDADARRSIPQSCLAPLLEIHEVCFFSLQKEETANEPPHDARLLDWMSECTDFMDTAALIANLDLVISVDTAVAHLAGALGREVWLLNRFDGDWRWGIGAKITPWYRTMTIFNQAASEEWEDVIRRVAGELRRFVDKACSR